MISNFEVWACNFFMADSIRGF